MFLNKEKEKEGKNKRSIKLKRWSFYKRKLLFDTTVEFD
jgi:hypothetical protein